MTKRNSDLHPNTQAAQALHALDPATGAVVPPMMSSSTFARDENYQMRDGYIYSRYGSPTTHQAEQIIASLEDADQTLLFNSGMSAVVAVLDSLPPGAHVVTQKIMCHVGQHYLERQAQRGILTFDLIDGGDLDAMERAIQKGKTKLVWVETPGNPDLSITDIRAAATSAHDAGALLMVDGTAAPPTTTRALDFGADLAFHSATKYMGGHSDLTAGAMSARADLTAWDDIKSVRSFHGTILPGFEAWLLIRGLRTLHVPFDRACANAVALATHFADHADIETVLYPGLTSHPGHSIAAAQMSNGFGGLMSVLVKGPASRALEVAKKCRVFIPATSLGGVESMIEHRKTVAGPDSPAPENLLRLSIGIEHVNDLFNDLNQALDQTR